MRLQWQMLWLVCTAVLAGVLPLWLQGIKRRPGMLPLSPAFVMLWAVGILCALGTAWKAKYHRLTALIMLGGAGLCTCLTFLWFSAPDLALTQLVVEVATTVLMLLGLRWMPKRDKACTFPCCPPSCAPARAACVTCCCRWLQVAAWPGWPSP